MFFVNLNLKATEKLNFLIETVYTVSEAGFSPFNLPEPTDIPDHVRISPDYPGGTTKGAYDFSGIGEYSDLKYTQLEGTLGANYRVAPRATLYGAINLLDLQDDQQYVYGDLTGAIVTYAAGMAVGF